MDAHASAGDARAPGGRRRARGCRERSSRRSAAASRCETGCSTLCADWPVASPRRRRAGPLPERADARPRAAPPTCARRPSRRAPRSPADPRRARRGGPSHRPLGARQRPRRLRRSRAGRVRRRHGAGLHAGAERLPPDARAAAEPRLGARRDEGAAHGRRRARDARRRAPPADRRRDRRTAAGDIGIADRRAARRRRPSVDGRSPTCDGVSYVPGVEVSGRYAFRDGDEHRARRRAAAPRAATLTIDADEHVSGTLDGRRVQRRPRRRRRARAARAGPSRAASRPGCSRRSCADGQRTRGRDLALPAPARGQPGRLAAVGRGGAAPRARARTGRCSSRSATRRATGAT